jgi:dTDP-4-dehydrorhamnose 3,5-epimerase
MIEILPTLLKEVLIIQPKVFSDHRGFFFESYNEKNFRDAGVNVAFVQDNHSRSLKNTLRGLHYQINPGQGKLVRTVAGEIFDVAVDIRWNLPTFGKWVGVNLSAENKKQLYVPVGFAHGFCVISDYAEVIYKCTDYYSPKDERGILWNDPQIGIHWPATAPLLSDRDQKHPHLLEIGRDFIY